ncbi:MAG: response regulator [Nannocystaceae bacterium]
MPLDDHKQKQGCVWLADDDAGTRDFLVAVYERAGYQVEQFSDGLELMRAVTKKPAPDVIITDIHMPGKEGIETIFFLKRHLSAVPVIAMSGGSSYGVNFLRLAEGCGAAKLLTKPFGAKDALAAVQGILGDRGVHN